MENIQLSLKERLSLVLQYRILQKLSQDSSDYLDYENKINALLNGFELHYNDLFEEFSEETLSTEECRKVLDILEMYRGIIFSFLRISKESSSIKLKEDDVRFPGFDGNNETKYWSYAKYFIEDLERYDEIKQFSKGDYNSHTKTLERYFNMLSSWNKLQPEDRYCMTESQIEELLKLGRWLF